MPPRVGKWSNVLEKTCESEEVPHGHSASRPSVGKVFASDSSSRMEADDKLQSDVSGDGFTR